MLFSTLKDIPPPMARHRLGKGQYRRSSLMALYDDKAGLPDVLWHLAHDCPKRAGVGNDSCGAYFPDLVERTHIS